MANVTNKDIAKILAEEVVELWQGQGNLSTIEVKSVWKKIMDVIAEGQNV